MRHARWLWFLLLGWLIFAAVMVAQLPAPPARGAGLVTHAYAIPALRPLALQSILKHEGGFANHPSDPGGRTLHGITQARYDIHRDAQNLPRRQITPSLARDKLWPVERAAIYDRYYFAPCRFDLLPAGLDYVLVDYCVNSGPGRGGRVIRAAVVVADARARAPDAGGPPLPDMHTVMETMRTSTIDTPILDAANRIGARRLMPLLCTERRNFVRRLATYRVFGPGWERRITEVCSLGIAMMGGRRASGLFAQLAPAPGKAFETGEEEEQQELGP